MVVRFGFYKDGKRRALTMSYDDGRSEDLRLLNIFNLHGIRGTFHLNSGRFEKPSYIDATDVRDKYHGHEVSVHTLTHPFFDRISNEELIHEVMADRENLEALCGYPVRGMSYPYGCYTEHSIGLLEMMGMKYSRTTKSTHGLALPARFMEWHPTCHHNDERLFEILERFKSYQYPMPLLYVWGHSYEFTRDENWDRIERFCTEAGGLDDVWYATNIEIYDYITALHALVFSADRTLVYNPSATDVWIEVDKAPVRIASGATVDLKTM